METKEHSSIIDRVVEGLRKAAVELEEIQLQTALGKAEAQDKYEDVKKKFNSFVHESKFKAKEAKEKVDDLHAEFDQLRVQLALGKAETKEKFQEQKKKLLLALHELEVKIKSNETFKRVYKKLLLEIEIFKIKLEIFEQSFETGRESAKASFEKGKQKFDELVADLKEKYGKKEETKWEHFQNELSEAFVHLKNAFVH